MLFVIVWNSQFSEYLYYLVYGSQDDPGKWFNQHISAAYIGKDKFRRCDEFINLVMILMFRSDALLDMGSGLIVDLV